jgi:hypothetical protein
VPDDKNDKRKEVFGYSDETRAELYERGIGE